MNKLVAWINNELELERMAKAELEKQIAVLQLRLEALRNRIREARRSPINHNSNASLACNRKRLQRPLGRFESHEQNL